MLITDMKIIGDNLYKIRTKKLLSRAEVAEKAELSDRSYADIERGSVTMRIDSLLKICTALNITPNNILVADSETQITEQDIVDTLKECSSSEKKTAMQLLNVYIDSLR